MHSEGLRRRSSGAAFVFADGVYHELITIVDADGPSDTHPSDFVFV
jgi:hypothetical protein